MIGIQNMKISTILDQVDLGSMALPEFQRGYVWSRDQVRELMQSLYRRYPVGSLLVWVTRTDNISVRGSGVGLRALSNSSWMGSSALPPFMVSFGENHQSSSM